MVNVKAEQRATQGCLKKLRIQLESMLETSVPSHKRTYKLLLLHTLAHDKATLVQYVNNVHDAASSQLSDPISDSMHPK